MDSTKEKRPTAPGAVAASTALGRLGESQFMLS
jgi:hypothetical protein